ncbi:MAG: hypothetical protein DRK00_01990 [Thermoprotei archaeon]|nr:MAG: hypothetical protein DRK00_01990 [Thermoprotei archaeon]
MDEGKVIPDQLVRQVVDAVKIVTRQLVDGYRRRIYVNEDHLTGALVSMLEERLKGLSIRGIRIVPRALSRKEEMVTGADLGVLMNIYTPNFRLSKALIAQAKRCECSKGYYLSRGSLGKVVEQCRKMLKITSSAFVLVYTNNFDCGILVFPAGDIIALNRASCTALSMLYTIRLDRLFEIFMKCHVGDPMIAEVYWNFSGLKDFMAEYGIRHGLLLMLISEERLQRTSLFR